LRDYGTEPIIWDGNPDCEHEWGKARKIPATTQWNTGGVFDPKKRKIVQEEKYIGQFCKKCGAWKGSLGLEPTFELYIKHLCDIFDETKRVLRKDGTLWINLGDTYNGNKSGNTETRKNPNVVTNSFNKIEQNIPSKSLCLIPFRFAIEMVNRGWILRNVIIWHKPNCMPSSAKDRFTVDFEYLFFFVKNKKYWFEQQFEPHTTLDDLTRRTNKYWSDDIADGGTGKQNKGRDRREFYGQQGRNKRTVWTIPTKPYPEAHFAVYPAELIRTCIKAGCPKGGVVLDPFAGSGTTLEEAIRQGKDYIGIELKDDYIELIEKRLSKVQVSLI
jgi:site-specific DNA-methyltransferase (adenine-specific)